jgi:hypothetical protein
MRNESKHRVFPPLVLITATYIWYIEQMQWLINAIGLQTQILKNDVSDSAAVVGIVWTSLSRSNLIPQCSIRFKHRLRAGHGITFVLVCWMKSILALALAQAVLMYGNYLITLWKLSIVYLYRNANFTLWTFCYTYFCFYSMCCM